MADVFISYKSEDRKAAEFIASHLSEVGISAWWDASLVAGEIFSEAIRAELRSARVVIVLWSRASWKSRWVHAEAQAGLDKGALVAARLDGVVLEAPFNVIQTADLREATGVASLIAGVQHSLGDERRSTNNTQRFQGFSKRWRLAGLGVALAGVIVAASSFVVWRYVSADQPAQIADIEAPPFEETFARSASFEVRFPEGSFWLNSAADDIALRIAQESEDPPDRVMVQSTCRFQSNQKLEDDRAAAVFVAIRRSGVPAEAISAHSCDFAVVPSVPPAAVRVSLLWLRDSSPGQVTAQSQQAATRFYVDGCEQRLRAINLRSARRSGQGDTSLDFEAPDNWCECTGSVLESHFDAETVRDVGDWFQAVALGHAERAAEEEYFSQFSQVDRSRIQSAYDFATRQCNAR